MINPARALVALATGEDVFTPDGAAVVIAHIEAVPTDGTSRRYVYAATCYGQVHNGRRWPLSELTAREDIGGAE